ncbi:MAG: TonB-dependent receptor [Nitrospirota bacterium]
MHKLLGTIAALGMAAVIGLFTSTNAGACASCGCTLSSDWENLQSPIAYTSGFRLDLRYDYLDQNQLRSGTGTIAPAAAAKIVNNNGPQEVERYTINNYVTLGMDYSINRVWGVNVQIPYIDRSHSSFGVESDGKVPGPGGGAYDSHTSSIGDIRITGRYQGFTADCNLGVLYGLKLPTGYFNRTGESTDPTAPGPVPIDRGLQPGTGTTDAILGAYYTNDLGQKWDYLAQVLYQVALDSRYQYRPGNGLNANAGIRYTDLPYVIPQMQLNFRYVVRDSGGQADRISTGGTLLYISPGVSVPIIKRHLLLYSFVQFPVFQDLNGVQLAPRFTTTVGLRYSF